MQVYPQKIIFVLEPLCSAPVNYMRTDLSNPFSLNN